MPVFATPAVFQDAIVPRDAELAGLAALVHACGLKAPLGKPSCVAMGFVKGGVRRHGDWTIYEKRYRPEQTLAGHLIFALKHEPLDLLILKRLFQSVGGAAIGALVRSAPTGAQNRRLWFFYEWLTGETLDIPDAVAGSYTDAIDPKACFTGAPVTSPRHRVRDNLLGVPGFCPVIRRTPALEELVSSRWDERAKDLIGRISKNVIARAASFLLLADSQASHQIEGERPPRNRIERWGRAVAQAGKHPLSIDELVRLQHIIIEDNRFVRPGLRTEGGFIGDRDPDNNPLPEFISARPEDLDGLLSAMIAAHRRMGDATVDAVLHAAAIAFGFVFVHPFEDGNGRLHRYLIHHVLAERGFTPPGMTFPISSVLLDRIDAYRDTLQRHSAPLMPFVEWRPTATLNVEVLNDTGDLYRYGDATDVAEFLYSCVRRTIEHDLPKEIACLRHHDEAKRRIQDRIEMPDRLIGQLIALITHNDGKLAKRRRTAEFAALTDDEVATIEAIVAEAFADKG